MSGIAVWNPKIHDELFTDELHKQAHIEWQIRTWGGKDDVGADMRDWLYAEDILRKELGTQPSHEQISALAFKIHESRKLRDWRNAQRIVASSHGMIL